MAETDKFPEDSYHQHEESSSPAFPKDGHAPSDPQESNKELHTDNMEVHHHTHSGHGKKTWKDYFWEFLMLFLAVFCGFLAEYQLEHVIEHKRAKEFAASMVSDLSADTSSLKQYRSYYAYVINNIDTLTSLLANDEPREIPTGKLYYYGLFGGAPLTFIPNDATIQQMKGSGSLRYFTNHNVNREVARYDQLCRRMRIRETDDVPIWAEVRTMRAKIFEYRYNDAANQAYAAYRTDSNYSKVAEFLASGPPLLSYDKTLFNQYLELVRSRFLTIKLSLADSLYSQASVLIHDLKKEYHLD